MTDRQMTGNEIIKALECCSKGEVYADCERLGCPLYLGLTLGCKYVDNENKLYADALDLINRLQADIERLKNKNEILSINADTAFQDGLNEAQGLYAEQVKAEVIKAFAERLKNDSFEDKGYYCDIILVTDIDDVLKEMVGETE